MIKLFRKIRQKILSENKFNKYLIYAVGEVILVVVGILIALQVNNWNEERKLNLESKAIYVALNSEFNNNRIVLKKRIDHLEEANKNVAIILSYINKKEASFKSINIDSIFVESLEYGNYNPANSSIQELISSGKLNLIKDDDLKLNLFNWLQLLQDTNEDFKNQDLQHQTQLAVYLSKNISFKNMAKQSGKATFKNEDSELFNKQYERIFADLEFENLYQSKNYWNAEMINHYKDLDSLASEIIKQTE
jgi:hypothetical protein